MTDAKIESDFEELLSILSLPDMDNSDLCFDGHHFAHLCRGLLELWFVCFAANLHLVNKPSIDQVSQFTKSVCAPFWLYGSLGRVKVCVGRRSQVSCIQMYSFPYIIPDDILINSDDVTDIQFNTEMEEKVTLNDLSMALQPLWSNMNRLIPYGLTGSNKNHWHFYALYSIQDVEVVSDYNRLFSNNCVSNFSSYHHIGKSLTLLKIWNF